MIEKLIVIGPGHSVNSQIPKIKSARENYKVLAFQGAYPHCEAMYGIAPDLWYSADPNGFVEGLEYLLSKGEEKEMEILVPNCFEGTVSEYRKYSGTSPVVRRPGAWENLQENLKRVRRLCTVTNIATTSTKFIRTLSSNPDLKDNIFGDDAYYRFMHDEAIIGSIPFDSESVIGEKYKWGLENKLSSSVLPICYQLKAREIYVIGFDLYGPRFYSDDDRHPWNDETQGKDVTKFPLQIIEQWVRWAHYHRMKIYSASSPDETLLSRVLPTKNVQ